MFFGRAEVTTGFLGEILFEIEKKAIADLGWSADASKGKKKGRKFEESCLCLILVDIQSDCFTMVGSSTCYPSEDLSIAWQFNRKKHEIFMTSHQDTIPQLLTTNLSCLGRRDRWTPRLNMRLLLLFLITSGLVTHDLQDASGQTFAQRTKKRAWWLTHLKVNSARPSVRKLHEIVKPEEDWFTGWWGATHPVLVYVFAVCPKLTFYIFSSQETGLTSLCFFWV